MPIGKVGLTYKNKTLPWTATPFANGKMEFAGYSKALLPDKSFEC